MRTSAACCSQPQALGALLLGACCTWQPGAVPAPAVALAAACPGSRGSGKCARLSELSPAALPCSLPAPGCRWCRLLQDALRTLPWQDPLASSGAWQRVKAGASYRGSCTLALAALDKAYAIAEADAEGGGSLRWEVLLAQARCARKLQQPAASWLPLIAQACRYAKEEEGGVLLPVYALHASRMRLLLGMPAAQRCAADGRQQPQGGGGNGTSRCHSREREQQQPGQAGEEQRALLHLLASYCFLPATSTGLRSLSQAAPASLPEAEAEAAPQAAWQSLLEDCCAAMQWCLDRNKNFHRAAYR